MKPLMPMRKTKTPIKMPVPTLSPALWNPADAGRKTAGDELFPKKIQSNAAAMLSIMIIDATNNVRFTDQLTMNSTPYFREVTQELWSAEKRLTTV